MYFEVKFSGAVKLITTIVVALLLSVVCGGIYFSAREFWAGDAKIAVVGLMYMILFPIGGGWLALRDCVSGYTLDADKLEIHRHWQESEIILLKSLECAELVITPFKKAIMVGATGGVGGFYGDFKQIGGLYFTAYVTDPRCCVMLTMKGDERIMISPYEWEQFLVTLVALRPDVQVKTV